MGGPAVWRCCDPFVSPAPAPSHDTGEMHAASAAWRCAAPHRLCRRARPAPLGDGDAAPEVRHVQSASSYVAAAPPPTDGGNGGYVAVPSKASTTCRNCSKTKRRRTASHARRKCASDKPDVGLGICIRLDVSQPRHTRDGRFCSSTGRVPCLGRLWQLLSGCGLASALPVII